MENYDCNQSAERVLMDASRKKNQNRNRLLFIVITITVGVIFSVFSLIYQKDGLPRGKITCCHCYPDWSGYWKCDWVLPDSCRLVLADYFMCDGRGWPFCIYYCDDCHSYSCKKSCGSISAGSIAIFRLSGENERKFRVAP